MSNETPIDTERTVQMAERAGVRMDACKIVQTTGAEKGRELQIAAPEITVGSAKECDLRIQHDTVSRTHFKILRDDQSYRIVDLGSTNGTFVDDARVKEAYLRSGAIIRAGEIYFRFDPVIAHGKLVPSEKDEFGGLFGQSYRMREIFAVLEQVARTDATILLNGETGTGKSAVARAIHRQSHRVDGPFMIVDCGAITPTLVESELFGHERGAFTGAAQRRPGALELADGGTLFIDELTELSLNLQPKLLRALEEREFTRVGSNQPIKFNCRIIAATQRDLWAEVEANRFRADLYFRLAVVNIQLPSLRERREDIPLLVDHFLRELRPTEAHTFQDLNPDLHRRLLSHDWPGNIRELRNAIERISLMFTADPFIGPARVIGRPEPGGAPAQTQGSVGTFTADLDGNFKDAKESLLSAFEKVYLTRLLQRVNGSVTEAAREAGLDRKHIYNLLSKHGIGT